MKGRLYFVRTAIIVTVLALLLPVPAAYSADWQGTVDSKHAIQCTVTNLKEQGWWNKTWDTFNLKYTFCDNNYWEFACENKLGLSISGDKVTCNFSAGKTTQECSGATWSIEGITSKPIPLTRGTANAQSYVCGEQFQKMIISVKPLNR